MSITHLLSASTPYYLIADNFFQYSQYCRPILLHFLYTFLRTPLDGSFTTFTMSVRVSTTFGTF